MRGDRKPNLEPVRTVLDAERLLVGIKLTQSLIVGKMSKEIEKVEVEELICGISSDEEMNE